MFKTQGGLVHEMVLGHLRSSRSFTFTG